MTEPHDPQETIDTQAQGPAADATSAGEPANLTVGLGDLGSDALEVGLAAAFGKHSGPPRSSLGAMRPVLLKEAEGESALVVRPASDAMPSKEEAGDRYQLSGEIARGGMGAVLRGRDVDLGRDLAVKVLLEKYANRPDVARRFIEEAQIGGQLQHPGVVPIYDIGRFGDRPFFTMKLVKGQTLAAILSERTDPTTDRPRLLNIALQVSQAMAYAHAKGVIHRDLKPANIMVGAFGEVQVMDWGLAKVLAQGGVADEERASRAHQAPDDVTRIQTTRSTGSSGSFGTDTEAGSILGTPAYMPPEQASGDIAHLDRRADVFALGALLCEILTGKPPYLGRSSEEVRRKAANGDQKDALERLDACGADAELISLTMICLSAEAIDRPKDAQEVTDGLTAYLNGVQERLRQAEQDRVVAEAKAVEERRRRRLQVGLAASLLVLTTLGGLGTTYVVQERAARAAAREKGFDRVSLLLAQANREPLNNAAWQLAMSALNQALDLGLPDTEAVVRVGSLLGEIRAGLNAAKRDRTLLDRLVDIRSAKTEDHDGSDTDLAYAEAFREAGIDVAKLPLAEVDEIIKTRPLVVAMAIAGALDDWASVRRNRRRDPAGAARLSRAARFADPDPWRTDLRNALDEPDKPALLARLQALEKRADYDALGPISLHLLGTAVGSAGDLSLAESVLRQAQVRHPRDVWVHYGLAKVLEARSRGDEAIRFFTAARALQPETAHSLAHALQKRGDRDESIAVLRDLKALRPGVARHHFCLGNALKATGRMTEAEEVYDDAIKAGREQVRLKPDSAEAHHSLGISLKAKGRKDQLDEAIACMEKAIELEPRFAIALDNWANGLHAKGRLDEAIAAHRKAIALEPENAAFHNNLGSVLFVKGQWDQAIACFKKAIKLDPKFVDPINNMGYALHGKGQYDEAIAYYKKAIELNPRDAYSYGGLGNTLNALGRLDESIASFTKASELNPRDAWVQRNLGEVLMEKGRLDDAIACFKKAIELNPDDAECHNDLAFGLLEVGDLAGARSAVVAALKLDPGLGTARSTLADLLIVSGRFAEALPELERAIEPLRQTIPEQAKIYEDLLPRLRQLAGKVEIIDTLRKLGAGDGGEPTALELAKRAREQGRPALAASMIEAVLVVLPARAVDLRTGVRYNAACYSALAAAGQGADADKLEEAERAGLRKQALEWLHTDLVLRAKQVKSGPPEERKAVQRALHQWQKDNDLASLRDVAALAKLAEGERKSWEAFWAEVADLIKKAGAN